MLESDRSQSPVAEAVPELGRPSEPGTSRATRVVDGVVVLSRLVVALALSTGGVVWAIARGMVFYGLTPSGLYDDLAQPPLLLILVGALLAYRSRRR